MSEQLENTVVANQPQVLANGNVYAVKVGPYFYGSLDEDG